MKDRLTLEEEMAESSDEEVLASSVRHPSLFAVIVRRYEQAFLRKAQSIVRDVHEAEDVVQETFTKIYLNAGKFRVQEGATFSSWGYRILINTSLTHYAKRKREAGMRADIEPEILELIPDKDMRQFEKKEFADEVATVLGKMPDVLARALAAFFLEGKSQEEIARDEGVSVGAVKTRVHRAKKEFKKTREALEEAVSSKI